MVAQKAGANIEDDRDVSQYNLLGKGELNFISACIVLASGWTLSERTSGCLWK